MKKVLSTIVAALVTVAFAGVVFVQLLSQGEKAGANRGIGFGGEFGTPAEGLDGDLVFGDFVSAAGGLLAAEVVQQSLQNFGPVEAGAFYDSVQSLRFLFVCKQQAFGSGKRTPRLT